MKYQVRMTDEADRQFQSFSANERARLETAIDSRLEHQPTTITKAVKRLRQNPFAEYQLRVDDMRVLYNVVGDVVIIVLFARKIGNKLFVEGEEFHGHQDNPPEPSGNGSPKDAD